jgi:hypothetical protein
MNSSIPKRNETLVMSSTRAFLHCKCKYVCFRTYLLNSGRQRAAGFRREVLENKTLSYKQVKWAVGTRLRTPTRPQITDESTVLAVDSWVLVCAGPESEGLVRVKHEPT